MPQKSGKKGNVAARVWELAEPLAKDLGLMLWDVQYVKEGADWFVRIFIDREEGVSIDDCVDMTHAIDPVLDEEDPVPQEYILEVSSPGLERKLTRPEHFEMLEGVLIHVKLIRPLEGGAYHAASGREFIGILHPAAEETAFVLELEDGTMLTLNKKDCSVINTVELDEEEL